MRIRLLATFAALAAAVALPAGSIVVPAAASEECCTVSQGYIDSVDTALASGHDVWGEQVMSQPNGPTYDNIKDFLIPINGGGVASGDAGSGYQGSTDTGAYYLPFTVPDGDTSTVQASTDPTLQHYALPLSDGGGVMADYHVPCDGEPGNTLPGFLSRCKNFYETQFFVGGDGTERYGSAQNRAPLPTLERGYLPVLNVGYTDASGVSYTEQTFAARAQQTTSLVSYTKITARAPRGAPLHTIVRAHVKDPRGPVFAMSHNALTSDGKTYLAFDGNPKFSGSDLAWNLDLRHGPRSIVIAMLITPTTVGGPATIAGNGAYARALQSVGRYWDAKLRQGTAISVPEPYVENAMRNILIQNLIMAWRTSVGNGYEDGYVPEDTDAITTMAQFGFNRDASASLQVLLNASRGVDRYPSWANGTKLEGLASYYSMTRNATFVRSNLPLVEAILAAFANQLASDPHGLLAQDSCCEDNAGQAYWFHGQAVAWRGMVDILPVLDAIGQKSLADRYRSAADGFGVSLRAAITASAVRLSDGTLFIPERLLSGDQPYDRITATREGSYWNLLVPYGLASGILSARQLDDALAYIHDHGGTLLGQTRFNWQGTPIGKCNPNNLPGYYGEGTDELYGWQYSQALGNAGQAEQLNLTFYGNLAHSRTRNTFISGEGADLDACAWQYYRQTWWSPMSTSNAVYLNALRLQLVHENLDDHGRVTALTLAPATPRTWLMDGNSIAVKDLPTLAGPVSYLLTSDLSRGIVRGRLRLPADASGMTTQVHLAVPAGYQITGVVINGRSSRAFDPGTESIDLAGQPRSINLVVHYSRP